MRWFWVSFVLITLAFNTHAAELDKTNPVTAIDQAVRAEMSAHDLPGVQLAVVSGGSVLYAQNYGLGDIARHVPVTPDSQFRIGSISKLFTAIAIMQLRDAGKLELDDPVTRFLPWFRLADDPTPRITLRELLLQLAGLPREPLGSSWNDHVMPNEEALIRDLSSTEYALAPETGWKYSNLGYAVLGLVIEAVSNQPYATYVQTRITVPLGMDHVAAEPQAGSPMLTTGYDIAVAGKREPREFLPMGGMGPAGGIAASALDLAKLAAWMLDDRDSPILSAATRREMLRVQAIFPDWSGGQGIGFEISRKNGLIRIGHAGRAAGYSARLSIDPTTKIGVVVLVNADDGPATRIAEQALTLFAPTTMPTASFDPDWSRFEGIYRSRHGKSAIGVVDGRLAWMDPTAADPPATRIFLSPAGPNRFRFDSGSLVGEIVTFETDPSGRVLRMRAAGATDEKE